MEASVQYPPWLVKRFYNNGRYLKTKEFLRKYKIRTVCQSALCPNMSECFSKGQATFLILGRYCSRDCKFCFIDKGKPEIPRKNEIEGIAFTAQEMKLSHVVITSVTRDDLPDKGAEYFAAIVRRLKARIKNVTVETLIPDLAGDGELVKRVCQSGTDILNHNIETVPRLYPYVRPQAEYARSLNVLKFARNFGNLTKSGIMLGLGETDSEILAVFENLRDAGVDILTIGQYLKPGEDSIKVDSFISPEKFEFFKIGAYDMGFKVVVSGPFVRSSYGAQEIMNFFKRGVNNGSKLT